MSTRTRRRRTKPAPLFPESFTPSWARRVYCKTCGEVQRNYGQWAALQGDTVRPHRREVADAAPAKKSSFSEPVTWVDCPGGPVDLVKDRAP